MAPTPHPQSQEPINVKLLLIGNVWVGKTRLHDRFFDNQWSSNDVTATTGSIFPTHELEVQGRKVKASLWDTSGLERFRTLTTSYYRDTQGVILVYDLSSRESFEALPRWLEEFENYVPPEVVKIVVGNKLDKENSREVPTAEAEAFAMRTGCLFAEVSSKTGVGVTDVFNDVLACIIDTPSLWRGESSSGTAAADATGLANTTIVRGPRAAESL